MKKELTEKLEIYLSNIALSYVKMHNLHWNLKGTQFKAVHEYLESLYETYSDILDEVAELLRMNGKIPPASMSEFISKATMKELLNREIFPVGIVLEILISDMKQLKTCATEVRLLASAEDDFCTQNMMEDNISGYNKNIWFIESMLSQ